MIPALVRRGKWQVINQSIIHPVVRLRMVLDWRTIWSCLESCSCVRDSQKNKIRQLKTIVLKFSSTPLPVRLFLTRPYPIFACPSKSLIQKPSIHHIHVFCFRPPSNHGRNQPVNPDKDKMPSSSREARFLTKIGNVCLSLRFPTHLNHTNNPPIPCPAIYSNRTKRK